MKKVILIGMLLLFSSALSEVLAQRGKQQDRNRQEQVRRGDRGQNRGKFTPVNNRRGQKRKVNRVVVNNNWRNYGRSVTLRDRGFYDFDSRRGRRVYVRRGLRPSNGHIWLAGHWSFNARIGRDVWVDGRWVVRRNNHRWRAAHYERVNDRRVWVDGCWIRL